MQFIRSHGASTRLLIADVNFGGGACYNVIAHASDCPELRRETEDFRRCKLPWTGFREEVVSLFELADAGFRARPCGCWPNQAAHVAMPDGTHMHAPHSTVPGPAGGYAVARLLDGVWTAHSWHASEDEAQLATTLLNPTPAPFHDPLFREHYGLPRYFTGPPVILPVVSSAGLCSDRCSGGLDETVKVNQRTDNVDFKFLAAITGRWCPCDGASPVCAAPTALAAWRVFDTRAKLATGHFSRSMLLAASHAVTMARLEHSCAEGHPGNCAHCTFFDGVAERLRSPRPGR